MSEPARALPPEDKPDIAPTIRPNLGLMQGGGEGDGIPKGNLRAVKSDKEKPGGLATAEANPNKGAAWDKLGGGALSASALKGAEGNAANFGFSATDKGPSGAGNAIKRFAAQHAKGGLIGGGAGASLAIVIVLGIATLLPFELVNLEKDLLGKVDKIEQRAEEKAAKSLFQHIYCRALPASIASNAANCKGKEPNDGDSEDNKTTGQQADETKAAQANGEGLTEQMDQFDFTNSSVSGPLAEQGIKVNLDANGKFAGFTDLTDNSAISPSDIANSDELFSRFEAALPDWEAGQLEGFRALMVEHAGATFDGIDPSDSADDVEKTVVDDISEGSSGTDQIDAQQEAEDGDLSQPTDPTAINPAGTDPASIDAVDNAGGIIGNDEKQISADVAAGEDPTVATEQVADTTSLGSPVLLASVATQLCSIQKSTNQTAKNRVKTITSLLIRHFNLIVSIADEIKTGVLKSAVVQKVMERYFNGNSSVQSPAPTKTDPNPLPSEASEPDTKSAAYQEIVGNPVSNDPKSPDYTPDISPAALPVANTGTLIDNKIQTVLNDTKLNFGCSALTSVFGQVIQTVFGGIQLIGGLFDFETQQAIITAGILAVQYSVQHYVLPDILNYFAPYAVDGEEDAVQWLNNSYVGGILSFSDFARSMGGSPLSTSAANAVTAAANGSVATLYDHESFVDRTFSLSNPASLLSRVSMDLPTSKMGFVSATANYFSEIPNFLGQSFADILRLPAVHADSPTENPGEPYNLVEYGFTDADATKYYPIDNEQYLFGTVSYGSQSATRISLLGDPNKISIGSVDPSNTDILHCFINSYDDAVNYTQPDQYCGTEGNFDMADLKPQPIGPANVAAAYCTGLGFGTSDQGCMTAMTQEAAQNDDIGHFRQYLLDLHVMNDLTSLTTNT